MSDRFEGVSVLKKLNIYDGGKVMSRTIFMPDGERKTLGVMFPGDYEFGTADRELMEMVAGKTEVLLPGKDQWQSFGPGDSFGIPANSSFKLRVSEMMEYVCTYFKD
ncbi:MAG: pyrimidine/purine nucleoside phosphorylase [Synergistaceae bacterium]|nr:pyrimidine/purine nucleoside phosphorylase [Synergistaceae bacterium]